MSGRLIGTGLVARYTLTIKDGITGNPDDAITASGLFMVAGIITMPAATRLRGTITAAHEAHAVPGFR